MGDTLANTRIINQRENGISKLDGVYGEIVVKHLKYSWPFKNKGKKYIFGIISSYQQT